MRLTGKFFICASFLPVIICLFFAVARAQTAVSYQFLEVVDWQGNPVAEATVEAIGYQEQKSYKTDEKGRIEKLPVYYGDYTTKGFTVSKAGYYPFRYEFEGSAAKVPLRIELLKIPRTDAERELIENEQRKREFFAAARKADVEAVRKFLRSGLSANLTTADLRGVPLEKNVPIIFYAAGSGDSQTVNEFLAAGADAGKIPDILITYLFALRSPNLYPAEKKALRKSSEETVESLIKAGANINPSEAARTTALIVAAQRGHLGVVKILIEKGAPVDAEGGSGGTALAHAVAYLEGSKARIEMADLLLRSGADVNFVTRSYNGCQTALMLAARNSDLETVKFLLANRADVNATCEGGETALKLMKNRTTYDKSETIREIIKLLEDAGAK